MKKIVSFVLIILLIISLNTIVLAKDSVSQLNSQINQAEGELSAVQNQKSQALKEVEQLTEQIAGLNNQISELNVKLESLNYQIEEKKQAIEAKQKEYDERQALLDKRLVAQYTTGKTSYLDVLLSSNSITDFISNYYLIEQLSTCDTELLTQIQNLKNQIEKEKQELETTKTEVETTKGEIQKNKDSLEVAKAQKDSMVATLTSEEKKIQAEIDAFEADKREILEQAAREAKEAMANGTYNVDYSNLSVSAAGGFICPLPGRSSSDITTGFYGYSGHGGVDFARNSKGAVLGTPVLAAKDGIVTVSMAKMNSSGNYTSYGEYVKINHQDGTSTLYAHMQPGSRTVSAGDYVTQGQQIGNVGQTGNATGPHLHFEIIVGGSRVNPANYLP